MAFKLRITAVETSVKRLQEPGFPDDYARDMCTSENCQGEMWIGLFLWCKNLNYFLSLRDADCRQLHMTKLYKKTA